MLDTSLHSYIPIYMNVLDVTRAQFNSMPPNQKQALKLQVCTTAGITDALSLQIRILEYIYVNSLNNMPVTLSDINRRYSRPAKTYETSTNQLVREMLLNDTVCMIERGGFSAVFSSSIYKELETGIIERKSTADLSSNLISNYNILNGTID